MSRTLQFHSLHPQGTFGSILKYFSSFLLGWGSYWPIVGRGQGYCPTSYRAQGDVPHVPHDGSLAWNISSAWFREVLSCFSHVQLFCDPMDWTHQASLSISKNTRGDCHSFLQGIFLTQESNPHFCYFLHWQAGSLQLTPAGEKWGECKLLMLVAVFGRRVFQVFWKNWKIALRRKTVLAFFFGNSSAQTLTFIKSILKVQIFWLLLIELFTIFCWWFFFPPWYRIMQIPCGKLGENRKLYIGKKNSIP